MAPADARRRAPLSLGRAERAPEQYVVVGAPVVFRFRPVAGPPVGAWCAPPRHIAPTDVGALGAKRFGATRTLLQGRAAKQVDVRRDRPQRGALDARPAPFDGCHASASAGAKLDEDEDLHRQPRKCVPATPTGRLVRHPGEAPAHLHAAASIPNGRSAVRSAKPPPLRERSRNGHAFGVSRGAHLREWVRRCCPISLRLERQRPRRSQARATSATPANAQHEETQHRPRDRRCVAPAADRQGPRALHR